MHKENTKKTLATKRKGNQCINQTHKKTITKTQIGNTCITKTQKT
jgi:hypothetical protein